MRVNLCSGTFSDTSVYADGWFDGQYGDFIRKGDERALYLGGQLEIKHSCDDELLLEIESELRKQLSNRQ